MKTKGKNHRTERVRTLFGALGVVAGVAVPSLALASSTNGENELKVYSLENYGYVWDAQAQTNKRWKPSVPVSGTRDAYDTFYPEMYNCTSNNCAYSTSTRYKDSGVYVSRMHSEMNAADMVFFYGHNISMREWNDDGENFTVWVPFNTSTGNAQKGYTGSWTDISLCETCTYDIFDWGTSVIPYYYHEIGTASGESGLQNAPWTSPAYSVFYGYNPLTSVLVGQDYKTGTWYTENTVGQSTPTARSGQLGSSDLEFFVANGCEAVPVAHYSNHYPGSSVVLSDQARQAWQPSWRKLHMALGHYYLTTTGCVPNLKDFADDLKAGDGVARAYFDAHSCTAPSGDPAMYQPGMLSPRNGIFDSDKWTTRLADPTTTDESTTWYVWYEVGN